MPGMRWMKRLGIAVAMVGVLLSVGGLRFVRDAYPADPFKSEALAKCLATEQGFIRYFAEDRARCYARMPQLVTRN